MDLVKMRGKDAVCDSLEVAEHFGKRHDNVVQTIDNLLKNKEIKVLKLFFPYTYKDSKGRTYRNYLMNRKGFTILVMGFNGEEAIHWKLMYSDAFDRMEQLLAQKQTEVYKDTRAYQKAVRKQETDTVKRLVDYAVEQGSKHAEYYYSSLSTLADKTAGIKDRDLATIEQLGILALVESIIADSIMEGITMKEPYKDIYQVCKQRLEKFHTVAFIGQEDVAQKGRCLDAEAIHRSKRSF